MARKRKAKRTAGQPTLLTPARVKRFLNALRGNAYTQQACAFAGYSYASHRLWMNRGEHALDDFNESGACDPDDEPHFEYYKQVTRVMAEAELALCAAWSIAAKQDWRAARDLLSVRHRNRWSKGGEDHTARGTNLRPTIYLPDNGRDNPKEGDE